jgi:methionine salvage enolase-phosphatase E1
MADEARQQAPGTEVAPGQDLGEGLRGRKFSGAGSPQRVASHPHLACKRKAHLYLFFRSALAQRLLFQTPQYGELTSQLDGLFDTKVGAKTDSASYREVLLQIACRPQELLFISDTIKELEAAQAVGIRVVWSLRPERDTPSSTGFPVVRSFDEIVPG